MFKILTGITGENFAVIWILKFFAEFCENFAVYRNFAVTFLPGHQKICGQTEIAKKKKKKKKESKHHIKIFLIPKRARKKFNCAKVIFLNSLKNVDHSDDF